MTRRSDATDPVDIADERPQGLFPAVEKIVGANRLDDVGTIENDAAFLTEVSDRKDDVPFRKDLGDCFQGDCPGAVDMRDRACIEDQALRGHPWEAGHI